jgi:Pyridoxamine 5'-phosphate oxidase
MGKLYDQITPDLAEWLKQQRIFFVATAPLAAGGLLNCSPKGMDTFRILDPRTVAYLDLTGSGIETIAHLRENGRIVFAFCAFEGPPKIVRLHGTGEAITSSRPDFEKLRALFPDYPGVRAVVQVRLIRIADSCGYAVPRYDYAGERDGLIRWAESKGVEGVVRYRCEKNARSLDDLPGLDRGDATFDSP